MVALVQNLSLSKTFSKLLANRLKEKNSADDQQESFFFQKLFIKYLCQKNSDLIQQNQGHFQTQSIKISLIQLENPGQLSKNIYLLPSVIKRSSSKMFVDFKI